MYQAILLFKLYIVHQTNTIIKIKVGLNLWISMISAS